MTWNPDHWITAPVLLPLVAAFLILVMHRADSERSLFLQRLLSVIATVALLGNAAALAWWSTADGFGVYRVGDWPVPVAIVLVLDRLSALMVLLTSVVALASVCHAVRGADRGARHFHPLFQIQLAGLNGAFLTGDLFNLFVFFEILLIASYCLLVFGGTTQRVRSGMHYVVLNLIGSAMFLIAVGALYGVTGTLNMAHMAQRVAALDPQAAVIAHAASLLLLTVFALKAAVVPLYFWLPAAYSSATAPVAALFALMTKVGVYAIVRFSTLVLGPDGGGLARLAEDWILPAALATIVLGTAGALGARELRRMQSYLLIASVGVILAAVGAFTARGLGAGLYYLVHSTLATAAMFLLSDIIASSRSAGGALVPGPRVAHAGLAGVMFFVGAIALSGMPPLSGFLGKALILNALPAAEHGIAWGIVLGGSLFAVASLGRAGTLIFWGPHTAPPEHAPRRSTESIAPLVPAGLLLAAMIAWTVAAAPATRYTDAAAAQLIRGADYVNAVLSAPGGR